MASSTTPTTTHLLSAIETRRSVYTITKSSPIPDSRIQEIVSSAITHAPSPFNVQSGRAVILFGSSHDKLWDIADSIIKTAMPEGVYKALAPRIAGFRGGYGTVMWFEDQKDLDELKAKQPGVANVVDEWSDHSSGMHQFIVWTAFTLEGLGCSLQHYNFNPEFNKQVQQEFKISETWKCKSQLVFGAPVDGLRRSHERTYKPVEERVLVIGGR